MMFDLHPTLFPEFESHNSRQKVVNVSSVPQRSPFRYAGGKTWLIPTIRKWLRLNTNTLVEPFLGGGSVSLTAIMEGLAPYAIMSEIDDEVASVWHIILSDDCGWLIDNIKEFVLNRENVIALIENKNKDIKEVALCTIIKNRVFHGGILANGSGMMKNGESGKGLASRWYPKTLCNRIEAIHHYRDKFEFHKDDAFSLIREYLESPDKTFFIDPPYTVAGRRLYKHFDIDHEELFRLVREIKGNYMMTYDNCPMVRQLADKYDLPYKTIPMTTTHLIQKEEIIISNQLDLI